MKGNLNKPTKVTSYQQKKADRKTGKGKVAKARELSKVKVSEKPAMNFKPHKFDSKVEALAEPVLIIPQEIMDDQHHIVSLCDEEVGWVGTIEVDWAKWEFTLTEVFLPKQRVHSATCELDGEGLAALNMELLGRENGIEEVNKLRYWAHSHGDMGCSPSGQDNNQFEEKIKDVDDFYIRAILNRKGEMKIDIAIKRLGIMIKDCKWHVPSELDEARREHWKKSIETNVQEIGRQQMGFWNDYEEDAYGLYNGMGAETHRNQIGWDGNTTVGGFQRKEFKPENMSDVDYLNWYAADQPYWVRPTTKMWLNDHEWKAILKLMADDDDMQLNPNETYDAMLNVELDAHGWMLGILRDNYEIDFLCALNVKKFTEIIDGGDFFESTVRHEIREWVCDMICYLFKIARYRYSLNRYLEEKASEKGSATDD